MVITCLNYICSKDRRAESLLRAKRSAKCNLIEALTLDIKIELPGFDWSKDVGNDFIGSNFGVKIVNYVRLHLCM